MGGENAENAVRNRFLGLVLLFAASSGECLGSERVGVVMPSEDERLVTDLVERLERTVTDGDAAGYLGCLTKPLAAKQRKSTIVRFLSHELAMDVEKAEILAVSPSCIEFAAKYVIYEDGDAVQIVSSVTAKRDGDVLLLSKEEILSQNPIRGSGSSDLGGQDVCRDGRCPPRNPIALPGTTGELSLFNDANGNPDPNGIMWIDPRKLAAFRTDRTYCDQCR